MTTSNHCSIAGVHTLRVRGI